MFPHGTRTGYTYGCRQECCRKAAAADSARRVRMRAYGRPTTDLVDAAPVRAHVLALKEDHGFSLERQAEAARVPIATIHRLVYGHPKSGRPPTRRIKPDTAHKLLRLTAEFDMLPDIAWTDAAGTRRRALALACIGRSLSWQAQQIGRGDRWFSDAVLRSETVRVGLARAMRDLYDEYWDQPDLDSPRSEWVRRSAERKGGLPPLAWDDEFLDLPDADLQAELSRRTAAMDSAEVHRCYRASLEGDRSPLIVAAAEEYLARRREKRAKTAA